METKLTVRKIPYSHARTNIYYRFNHFHRTVESVWHAVAYIHPKFSKLITGVETRWELHAR